MKKTLKVAVVSALAVMSMATIASAADVVKQETPYKVQTPVRQEQIKHNRNDDPKEMASQRGQGREAQQVRGANPLDAAVAEGKITGEQKTKIMDTLKEIHEKRMKQREEENKKDLETLAKRSGVSKEVIEEIFQRPHDENRRGPQGAGPEHPNGAGQDKGGPRGAEQPPKAE